MKRYDLDHVDSISEFEDGDYVRYDEAAARIAGLLAECEVERAEGAMAHHKYMSACAERDAARTELAQLREGIALRAKGQVGPDALVEELRTELAAARVNEARWLWYRQWAGRLDDLPDDLPEAKSPEHADEIVDSQLAAEKGAQ